MPYVFRRVGLSPATMPTWCQLNCAKHAFKLKGHRVTVRLKSLPSMIYILLFAKRQLESFNYIHTDIILCQEALILNAGSTFGRVAVSKRAYSFGVMLES